MSSSNGSEKDEIQYSSGIGFRMPSIGLRFPPRTRVGKTFFSLIVSALLLSSTVKILTVRGILMLLTLSLLVYIIIDSVSGSGKGLSVPSSTYPLPPRLGHDGVSLDVMNM